MRVIREAKPISNIFIFQVTTTFSDLHDTPQRMLAKGVIQEIIDWKDARNFFYWKVRRRLLETEYEKKLKSANKYGD